MCNRIPCEFCKVSVFQKGALDGRSDITQLSLASQDMKARSEHCEILQKYDILNLMVTLDLPLLALVIMYHSATIVLQ